MRQQKGQPTRLASSQHIVVSLYTASPLILRNGYRVDASRRQNRGEKMSSWPLTCWGGQPVMCNGMCPLYLLLFM